MGAHTRRALFGVIMQGEMVLYNGKLFPKEGFRTFVYAKDGTSKLVESWPDYEKAMASGLWFATKQPIIDKPKAKKKGA